MAEDGIIKFKSLKDQVYDYLRLQLQKGEILPGSVINIDLSSKRLGISKTPMRDALLQLEMEGFVTILPRRGVVVNPLTWNDIKHYFQVIGALESTAIIATQDYIGSSDIKYMKKLCIDMKKALAKDNFNMYYEKNVEFHNVFLNLSKNPILKKTVENLKKRLYDFPRPKNFIKGWEEILIKEHEKLIDLISQGKFIEAANFMRDVHWSFEVQEKFVRSYYRFDDKS